MTTEPWSFIVLLVTVGRCPIMMWCLNLSTSQHQSTIVPPSSFCPLLHPFLICSGFIVVFSVILARIGGGGCGANVVCVCLAWPAPCRVPCALRSTKLKTCVINRHLVGLFFCFLPAHTVWPCSFFIYTMLGRFSGWIGWRCAVVAAHQSTPLPSFQPRSAWNSLGIIYTQIRWTICLM